jgi:hypothetical protein
MAGPLAGRPSAFLVGQAPRNGHGCRRSATKYSRACIPVTLPEQRRIVGDPAAHCRGTKFRFSDLESGLRVGCLPLRRRCILCSCLSLGDLSAFLGTQLLGCLASSLGRCLLGEPLGLHLLAQPQGLGLLRCGFSLPALPPAGLRLPAASVGRSVRGAGVHRPGLRVSWPAYGHRESEREGLCVAPFVLRGSGQSA